MGFRDRGCMRQRNQCRRICRGVEGDAKRSEIDSRKNSTQVCVLNFSHRRPRVLRVGPVFHFQCQVSSRFAKEDAHLRGCHQAHGRSLTGAAVEVNAQGRDADEIFYNRSHRFYQPNLPEGAVVAFYSHYNKAKAAPKFIDKTIELYAGKFDEMWRLLEQKYGPEGAIPKATATQSTAPSDPSSGGSLVLCRGVIDSLGGNEMIRGAETRTIPLDGAGGDNDALYVRLQVKKPPRRAKAVFKKALRGANQIGKWVGRARKRAPARSTCRIEETSSVPLVEGADRQQQPPSPLVPIPPPRPSSAVPPDIAEQQQPPSPVAPLPPPRPAEYEKPLPRRLSPSKRLRGTLRRWNT